MMAATPSPTPMHQTLEFHQTDTLTKLQSANLLARLLMVAANREGFTFAATGAPDVEPNDFARLAGALVTGRAVCLEVQHPHYYKGLVTLARWQSDLEELALFWSDVDLTKPDTRVFKWLYYYTLIGSTLGLTTA